jgi:protein-disulfide isomerase
MLPRTRLAVPVTERDHHQGPATATVTLVQYGDYECPYTRQSTTVVKAIQNQLGDQLRFVFRNFPLIEIHPHALNAALAAEAAAAQGKFWEMHDYIFHHQHTLEDADLTRFAEAVGLDMEQYAHDMMQQSYLPRIEEDVESGERSGVQGTPTFFINGILYRGSWEQHTLLTALEAASQGS